MTRLKHSKRLSVSCIFDPYTNDLLAVGVVLPIDGKTYYAYDDGKVNQSLSRKVQELFAPRLTELEGVEGGCIEITPEYTFLDFFTFIFLRELTSSIDDFRLVFRNEAHMHLIGRELDLHNGILPGTSIKVTKELIDIQPWPSPLPNAIQYNAGWDARALTYAVYLRGSVAPLRQEYIMPSKIEAYEYLSVKCDFPTGKEVAV